MGSWGLGQRRWLSPGLRQQWLRTGARAILAQAIGDSRQRDEANEAVNGELPTLSDGNAINVRLSSPESLDLKRLTRHVFSSSSCGSSRRIATSRSVIGDDASERPEDDRRDAPEYTEEA